MLSVSNRTSITYKVGQKLGKCHLTMTNARLCTLAINREHQYTMELGKGEQPHKIEKSLVERDLGLMVSSDLKWDTQV